MTMHGEIAGYFRRNRKQRAMEQIGMPQFKVYGGFINGRRAVMGTTSRTIVATACGESVGSILKYWAVSRNDNEIRLCTEHPNRMFVSIETVEPNFRELRDDEAQERRPGRDLRKREGRRDHAQEGRAKPDQAAAVRRGDDEEQARADARRPG